jgi:hypothetical protein
VLLRLVPIKHHAVLVGVAQAECLAHAMVGCAVELAAMKAAWVL